MNPKSHSLFRRLLGSLLLSLMVFVSNSLSAYELEYAQTGYQVTSGMDYAINYELKKLIASHEKAFGRPAPPSFKITYKVFPTYEMYRAYSAKNGKNVVPQLLGYTQSQSSYNPDTGIIAKADVEVVTWRQAQPAVLTSTILHESAHAVMHAFLLQVPLWMNEGSADWFGQPAWANGTHQQLDRARRWQTLGMMLEEHRLPPLRPYLISKSYDDWSKMFAGNIGMGYVVGYSIFDFFMSHPNAQQMLTQLLRSEAVEKAENSEIAFAQAIDKSWPGGLTGFEKSWHQWIRRKSDAERLAMQSKMKQK
ncbi:MAG TPA: hypothetical protein VGH19_02720 [Verrucomicrobiae bacterium]